MEAEVVSFLFLKERTRRKISQLSVDLKINRKRLERWVDGALSCDDLLISEYQAIQSHELFKDLIGSEYLPYHIKSFLPDQDQLEFPFLHLKRVDKEKRNTLD